MDSKSTPYKMTVLAPERKPFLLLALDHFTPYMLCIIRFSLGGWGSVAAVFLMTFAAQKTAIKLH